MEHAVGSGPTRVRPEGWQQLDNAATSEPTEVLVVGTSARPDDDPIGGCDPSATLEPGSAFVSVYEYPTGTTLNAPDHQQVYVTTQFISRPADFATVSPVGPSTCLGPELPITSTPAEGDAPSDDGANGEGIVAPSDSRVADFTFLDTGRFFVVRVVVSGDPEGTRFDEALGVLNSLDIIPPPEVTTTTDPAALRHVAHFGQAFGRSAHDADVDHRAGHRDVLQQAGHGLLAS